MRLSDLRERALAWLPRPDVPAAQLVLFALGIGALASVAVSLIQQLSGLLLQQRAAPISGDAMAVMAGVLVVCLVRGLDRAALWVPAVHAVHLAATFFIALLVYVYLGRRAVGDPLAQLGPAFSAVIVGAALGAVVGTIARSALPQGKAESTPLLVRAIGVAVVAGTVVHVFWPSALFAAVVGGRADDIRTAAVSLPDLLVGPIAGGIYAAQRGAGYIGLLVVGLILALPSALAVPIAARGQSDPSLRGIFAVLFMLLGLRIAAWPLAAAFVHGFLTSEAGTPSVEGDS